MRVLHAENENERFVRLSRGWCVWFFSEFIEDHAKPPTWTFGLHTMPRHQICSIPGCSSRSDSQEFEGVNFHCIPQHPDLKPEWLVNIRNPVCMKLQDLRPTLWRKWKNLLILHFQVSSLVVFLWNTDNPQLSVTALTFEEKHEKSPTPTEVIQQAGKLKGMKRELYNCRQTFKAWGES